MQDTRTDIKRATAEAVDKARKAAGVDIETLALASGIPYSTLHRRLAGVNSFTVDDLGVIARTLGVSATTLAKFEGAA